MFILGLEPGTIGGLLLIAGAWALYKGSLIWSVAIYFFADIMWLILAYEAGDTFGSIAVGIGMLLGLLVWIKTHRGTFVKNLHVVSKEN